MVGSNPIQFICKIKKWRRREEGDRRSKFTCWADGRRTPNEQLGIHHQRNDCIKHRICAIWILSRKNLGCSLFYSVKWIIIVSQMNWTWSYVRFCLYNWGWKMYVGSASEITLRQINDAVWLLNSHFKRKLKSKKRKLSLGIHLTKDEKSRCVLCSLFFGV